MALLCFSLLLRFFYLLILLCMNSTISALFRSIAYVAANPDVARNLSGPLTACFLLFGGTTPTRARGHRASHWSEGTTTAAHHDSSRAGRMHRAQSK